MVRQRRQKPDTGPSVSSVPGKTAPAHKDTAPAPSRSGTTVSTTDHHSVLDGTSDNIDIDDDGMAAGTWVRRNQWIVFALASGACAAFNGVFAKL